MTTWTPEQQAEHRQLWVQALRSGKYTQTAGRLRGMEGGTPKHCCLGVACNISELGAWRSGGVYDVCGDRERGRLPSAVQNWLGLRTKYGERGTRTGLTDLNDRGASFKEIADIIESEPEGLT